MFVVGETTKAPADWTKTHAAPTAPALLPLSPHPPTMAVLPSPDSATEMPCRAGPTASVPTSLLSCWVQRPLLRVKTHAAPANEPITPSRAGGLTGNRQRRL
jgi:hypothetical protein